MSDSTEHTSDSGGLWGRETGMPTLTPLNAARRPTSSRPAGQQRIQVATQHLWADTVTRDSEERREEENRRGEQQAADDRDHERVYVRVQWEHTTRYEADLYVDPWASEAEVFDQLAALPASQRRVLTAADGDNHLISVVDLDGDGHIDAYEMSTAAAQVDDWGAIADDIDESIAESPSWPRLTAALSAADRNGAAVEGVLSRLAGEAPLPDHDPAGELYYRLLNSGVVDFSTDNAGGTDAQPPPRRDEAPTYSTDAPRCPAPTV